jgi:hypothetical protein
MLGKINYVEDLRTIWKHEEKDFTPWLAENISLLGEALGLDLEVTSVEHGVGAFSLDILAKDTSYGRTVAIENQLEITDHNHLGQIITYASGVVAKTVIWITKEMREEHQKAIDWLNEITGDDLEFYGVEIQLIKVDDSNPAPFFNVKVFPNGWSKEQKKLIDSSGQITQRREEYHNLFTALIENVNREIPGFTHAKKVNYDSWKSFPTGIYGVVYSVAFRSGDRLSCELYFDSAIQEQNKLRYDMLFENKEKIEAVLGELSWERLDEKKGCRIAVYTDFTNEKGMVAWAIGKLKEFRACFKQYINQKGF